MYFGENSASEKIVSNTKELSHLFQDLEVGKKYYYKVVPKGSSFVFDENSFFYQEQGVKIFDGNTSLNNQDEITNFGQKSFTGRYTHIELDKTEINASERFRIGR